MMILWLIGYAIIGLGAGLLGGLLGISGGIITVPCLVFLFRLQGFPTNELMQLAIGTSLAAMVFNTLSSMRAHHTYRTINWGLIKKMLPGLILGCLMGAFFGHLVPGSALQWVFGLFAVFLGLYFYRYRKIIEIGPAELPSIHALNSLGFGVGAFSNILGIGGGTLTVPLFVKLKVPIKSAVASSTVTGFIVSLAGALAYLFFGLSSNQYEMNIGYIYLPAFITLALTTFIAAPIGAQLTHQMRTKRLRKIFAVSLVAIGFLMMLH